jgi:hypothetical protein
MNSLCCYFLSKYGRKSSKFRFVHERAVLIINQFAEISLAAADTQNAAGGKSSFVARNHQKFEDLVTKISI